MSVRRGEGRVNAVSLRLERPLTKVRSLRDCSSMSSIMTQRTAAIASFVENPVFLSTLTSWFVAQLLKVVIVILRTHRRSAREVAATLMWRTGGMPSSHSSLVAALATSVAFVEGIGSTLFIVTLCLAMIVIRDSLGVRRSSGLQARSLNLLGREVSGRLGIDYRPVKEIQGHAPLEVLVGALLGLFIAIAFAVL